MNRKIGKKVIASVLCVTFTAGVIGTIAYASGKETDKKPGPQHINDILVKPDYTYSDISAKDETVYVFSDSSGEVQNILVSNWLRNGGQTDKVKDYSTLENIENIKGSETFTVDGENMEWNADGHDIYYQGITEKEPPVGVSIHYKLDGNEITPEDLAGKNGRVTIRYDYENYLWENKRINGREEKLAVPFTVMTGLVLDGNRFQNVEVTNGSFENTGKEIVVFGVAFPSMQESLAVKDLELPSYIEISADAKEFQLAGSITVVSSSFLNHINKDKLDISDLRDKAQKLSDGTTELSDGAVQLADGLAGFKQQASILVDGVAQLSQGSAQLKDGIDQADNGAMTLVDGAEQLSNGLNELEKNSQGLRDGAGQIFDFLIANANQQIQAQISASGLPVTVPTLTTDNYDAVLEGMITKIQGLPIPGFNEVAGELIGLKDSLDSYQNFYTGLQNYTMGVDAAVLGLGDLEIGAKELIDGIDIMKSGSETICTGIGVMEEKVPKITVGVAQLQEGSEELREGIATLIEEGIGKIVNMAEEDLTNLQERGMALADLAQKYESFSGKRSDMVGSVKFIYKTDEIKSEVK